MTVQESLDKLYLLAKEDKKLRQELLDTKNSHSKIKAFCDIACKNNCELFPMELIMAGEERYAAMRRSTNGGGENSPLLQGEDDSYELFLAMLEML